MSETQATLDRIEANGPGERPTVEPHPRSERARHEMEIPQPPTTSALTLTREREKRPVDEFVSQWHSLDPVPGWKAAFSARHRGMIVAICIVGRPVARQADNGYEELSITRYCSRPDRPPNTGSWLIARARNWARLEGYDRLSAHAGVAGNWGDVYEAAGFDLVDETDVNDAGWGTRDGRSAHSDYTRRKWVYDFE